MATLLKGAPVAAAINEKTKRIVEDVKASGVTPTLAILRVGDRSDDVAYERGAGKRCASVGVAVRNVILPEDVDSDIFFSALQKLNEDDNVHGILLFCPLPKQLDEKKARQMIRPEKDVDGCTDASLTGVFTNKNVGFPPCTAQAAMEILHFYGIDISGKRAAVIGRSLVVGRPVSMMLMSENATVTICHTRTEDISAITRQADILVTCSGQLESVTADYVREGQVVIDVGIGWSEKKGKLCGDVDFDAVEPIVDALSPVPGGVGAVTTSLLALHVAQTAGNHCE
ncbi:MAG: bifunctional 5,10-methylene-tetrahydrofolate dehydrogenase/5,10-methylene-tetrahydrofolate cyclohydrolase [Clostridiales bacterium]|nr:bifunctional 5,10-methylene-tetrahydrofolate dehydrogenase/5,10-methylene-tetrahydrofolate cyclohydrolase [Clostridiales bacterium]